MLEGAAVCGAIIVARIMRCAVTLCVDIWNRRIAVQRHPPAEYALLRHPPVRRGSCCICLDSCTLVINLCGLPHPGEGACLLCAHRYIAEGFTKCPVCTRPIV